MEGIYPILHGGQSVGQVTVTRKGLYYHFFCRMQLSGEIICRLEVTCGGRTENLGIPAPENGAFCLQKTLPVSRFGRGEPDFRILPKHAPLQGQFIPINPEEPFAYLDRLQDAYLQYRSGQMGIVFRR